MNLRFTARCIKDGKRNPDGCERLRPVVQVKRYEAYGLKKDQRPTCEPGEAYLVSATMDCSHSATFISTWRQLQPHVHAIGARA